MTLTALIEEYLQAGPTATRNAAMMTRDLDPPDNCMEVAYLEGHPAPRLDQLRDVQAIKRTLVRAYNLLALGQPLGSLAAVESVRGRAALTGWRPLVAAVDYAAGKAYESLQLYQRSAFYLEQAFQEAAISNDRVAMADAAILSVHISSSMLTQYSEAHRWARLAEIPLATLEPSGGIRSAVLLHSRAGIYENNGDYPQAASLFRQAVETQEKIVGKEDSQLALPLNNLGTVLLFTGHLEESRKVLERAVQILERTMRPRHPALVSPLVGLGNVHRALGQRESARTVLERAISIIEESHAPPDASLAECLNTLGAVEDDPSKARDLFQRALAIREKVLPPNHPDIGKSRNNLAALAFQAGSYLDALKTWQRVAAIQEQTLGTAHPDLALTLLNLSAAQLELGFLADARSSGTRAIEIWRGAGLGELPMIGLVLVNLADISIKQHEPAAARDFALAALEHLQRTLGPEHVDVAHALVALSEVELAADRPDAAVDPAARALKLRETTEVPEQDLVAQARFCLARALWSTPPGHGRDRPRARDLTAQALAGYKAVSATRPEIAKIERWQAAHHSE
ncbi:MAG: tetratricopeptide repeat protein [Nannocystis sp.]|uniref:tetratricopeptide repeat protein n=1 Tax=Nannocystis sp. TaxID=1962667 RepID=UPI0024239EA3|nr:tetratricopeptide repeat protein [Nannocystis sp.]MBK9755921.1 tetratricopeptide repeat protein [Nannocystis sp.]